MWESKFALWLHTSYSTCSVNGKDFSLSMIQKNHKHVYAHCSIIYIQMIILNIINGYGFIKLSKYSHNFLANR